MKRKTCTWNTYGYSYVPNTSCGWKLGKLFIDIFKDGMKFCPGCGKPIVLITDKGGVETIRPIERNSR